MKKYNKSEILKSAWRRYRNERSRYRCGGRTTEPTFGECLKTAWAVAKREVAQAEAAAARRQTEAAKAARTFYGVVKIGWAPTPSRSTSTTATCWAKPTRGAKSSKSSAPSGAPTSACGASRRIRRKSSAAATPERAQRTAPQSEGGNYHDRLRDYPLCSRQ